MVALALITLNIVHPLQFLPKNIDNGVREKTNSNAHLV